MLLLTSKRLLRHALTAIATVAFALLKLVVQVGHVDLVMDKIPSSVIRYMIDTYHTS